MDVLEEILELVSVLGKEQGVAATTRRWLKFLSITTEYHNYTNQRKMVCNYKKVVKILFLPATRKNIIQRSVSNDPIPD
jgi:hypothetical protein